MLKTKVKTILPYSMQMYSNPVISSSWYSGSISCVSEICLNITENQMILKAFPVYFSAGEKGILFVNIYLNRSNI